MLAFAFEELSQDRKNLKVNINKTEGLQLARQEKNEIETENANATYQKTFDAQLDLIIKQIETKRKHGDPEEKKVEEIFDNARFRDRAENAIKNSVEQTNKKVELAMQELNLDQITSSDEKDLKMLMISMKDVIRENLNSQAQSYKQKYNQLVGNDKDQTGGAEKIN